MGTAEKSSAAGETVTVVWVWPVLPPAPVPVNWKTSVWGDVTAGAWNDALVVLAPLSATVGPLICVQEKLVAFVAVEFSVTILPEVVATDDPAGTKTCAPEPPPSSLQPASSALPNTAAVSAPTPPPSVWRRE